MKPSEERLVYIVLILGLIAMSAFLGLRIRESLAGTELRERRIASGEEGPGAEFEEVEEPAIFQNIDRMSPILTPVPTPTPRPEPTPVPTRVPFAHAWKVKTVIANTAIMLDRNDKQHTVRLGDILSEDFETVPEADFNAGQRGVKIVSMDNRTNIVKVRNFDGRITDVHPLGPKRG